MYKESRNVEGVNVILRGYAIDAKSASLTRGRSEGDYEFLIEINNPKSISYRGQSIAEPIVIEGKYLIPNLGPQDQRRDRAIDHMSFIGQFSRLENLSDLVPFLEEFTGKELTGPSQMMKEFIEKAE